MVKIKNVRKCAKDKRRPRRPKNSYFMYSTSRHQEARLKLKEIYKKEHPNLTDEEYKNYKTKVSDVGKYLGNQWRNMNADQKRVYQLKAKEAKVEYDKQFGEYIQIITEENCKSMQNNAANDIETSEKYTETLGNDQIATKPTVDTVPESDT
jgi:hypothetical protein